MENKVSVSLINNAYQLTKSILSTIDNFMTDIKNEKLQKLCAENVSKFDLIIDECKMLIKTYNEEIEDINFFDKYQNLISLKLASLTKKSTYEISEIIFLSICETLPKLYSLLIYNDLDEILLIKKLLKQNEEFLENLKQFFVAEN